MASPIKDFGPNDAIPEGSDRRYKCKFFEAADGEPQIDDSAILTITATLRDISPQGSNNIINSRLDQSVLNTNGGTLATDGTFALFLTGNTDNVCMTPQESGKLELHKLTIKVTYTKSGGGTGYLNHEIRFYVMNLGDV
jgi:hypothetical protein